MKHSIKRIYLQWELKDRERVHAKNKNKFTETVIEEIHIFHSNTY